MIYKTIWFTAWKRLWSNPKNYCFEAQKERRWKCNKNKRSSATFVLSHVDYHQ